MGPLSTSFNIHGAHVHKTDEAGDAAPAKAAPAEVLAPEELLRRAEEEANIDEVRTDIRKLAGGATPAYNASAFADALAAPLNAMSISQSCSTGSVARRALAAPPVSAAGEEGGLRCCKRGCA